MSTNGHVNFLAQSAAHSNTAIPNAAVPNAALYPFWDDLIVDAESSVRTRTVGTAPNRRFVIEWLNVTLFADLDPAARLRGDPVGEPRTSGWCSSTGTSTQARPSPGPRPRSARRTRAGDKASQLNFNQGLIFDGLSVAPK